MSKEAVCSPRADGLVARGAKCERYHSMRLTKERAAPERLRARLCGQPTTRWGWGMGDDTSRKAIDQMREPAIGSSGSIFFSTGGH